MMRRLYVLILIYMVALSGATASGAKMTSEEGLRQLQERYTVEHPLIYEDAWAKWPYAFINDHGQPDGFNIELVREVFSRLRIPYEIRLTDQHQAHQDIMHHMSHLTFGVAADYNQNLGHFGHSTVCFFENSLLHSDIIGKQTLELSDLRGRHITLVDDSRAYHYVRAYGIPDSMLTVVPYIDQNILDSVVTANGCVLWNSVMMKGMLNKYHITGSGITPVNIPAGEYRMISSDTLLLHYADSVCEELKAEGKIDKMITYWMFPEKQTDSNVFLYVLISLLCGLIVVAVFIYVIHYYHRNYSLTSLYDINMRMDLILHANKIKVWVYYPNTRRYAWMNRDGKVGTEYSSFEFSRFFPGEDFNIIHSHVMECLQQSLPPTIKTLRSYKLADRTTVLDVEVHIRTMHDDYGKVYLVCGIQHDITDSKAALERLRLMNNRYRTAFNIASGGIIRFDAQGRMIELNDRLIMLLGIKDKQALLDRNIHISDFGVIGDYRLEDMPDDMRFCSHIKAEEMHRYVPFADAISYKNVYAPDASQTSVIRRDMYFYVHFIKSCDDAGNFICYLLYIRDITQQVAEDKRLAAARIAAQQMEGECRTYKQRRDYALKESKIWMLRYYPDTKRIVLYDRAKNRMQSLSQLQILEMVDGKYMKRMFKLFHRVDGNEPVNVHLNVGTILRSPDGKQKFYYVDAHPVYGEGGKITNYFGICTDITAHISTQRQLKHESTKAQEAEQLRQKFLRNMSYSIRQPLVSMQQSVEKLFSTKAGVEETQLIRNITSSVQRLTMLSDDTLLLSRIESGMMHPELRVQDFVPVFRDSVEQALSDYRHESVTYHVVETYKSLILNIDKDIVSRILRESVALSARYTHYGTLDVRYMYHNNTLTIAVENTGQGIPPVALEHIFEPNITDSFVTDAHAVSHLSGLEMAICKSLVELLGGTIEVKSDPHRGNTIYISLPLM